MAIWQFTFYLVPRQSLVAMHDGAVLTLRMWRPSDVAASDEEGEEPNYWVGSSPKAHADAITKLLPARQSWSPEGLMFGDDKADDVELWDEDFRVRLDLRNYNEQLAVGIVNLAASADLVLVCGQTGRVLPPEYPKLLREIQQSRAQRYVVDPIGTLKQIGREQQDE
jgi:hypothetical protein